MDDKIFDQIQQVDLKKTMETSYIDYAMSVIASRAAYFTQVQNGVYVRMALILTLLGIEVE